MNKSKLISVLILLLFLIFSYSEINDLYYPSLISRSLIVPLFTILYFIRAKKPSKLFTWFLVIFSIADLMGFLELIISTKISYDIYYVIGNLMYVIAYFILVVEIFRTIVVKDVLKYYKIHLLVLMILNVYLIYTLIEITNPGISKFYKIFIELGYNIVMLVLLTVSLISYLYNDNKKSLLLFFGSLCVVFSEVILIAYYYLSDRFILNISSTLLLILAFTFYYHYSLADNTERTVFRIKS